MSNRLHFFTLNYLKRIFSLDLFEADLTLVLLYKNGLYTSIGYLYIQKKVLKHSLYSLQRQREFTLIRRNELHTSLIK